MNAITTPTAHPLAEVARLAGLPNDCLTTIEVDGVPLPAVVGWAKVYVPKTAGISKGVVSYSIQVDTSPLPNSGVRSRYSIDIRCPYVLDPLTRASAEVNDIQCQQPNHGAWRWTAIPHDYRGFRNKVANKVGAAALAWVDTPAAASALVAALQQAGASHEAGAVRHGAEAAKSEAASLNPARVTENSTASLDDIADRHKKQAEGSRVAEAHARNCAALAAAIAAQIGEAMPIADPEARRAAQEGALAKAAAAREAADKAKADREAREIGLEVARNAAAALARLQAAAPALLAALQAAVREERTHLEPEVWLADAEAAITLACG